ncbi:MAG: hypothetical protein M1837_003325 [Sclerophora amabilis]|nr:MAG: hypothetical protein M1837_003325 [Sclerophora amabilis]
MSDNTVRLSHLGSPTRVPCCIYGTAEKKDAKPIIAALAAGYRGLDSACQPQYYDESIVGEALQVAFAPPSEGGLGLTRSDIYLQTKFTTPAGHTTTTSPYLPGDSTKVKVLKSLEMSLSRLKVSFVDTLLLHGPMPTLEETLNVWRAMESCVGEMTRNLGICNVTIELLQTVYAQAKIPLSIVQNRFWRQSSYDRDLREYCQRHGITYQAFWILKANPDLLGSKLVGWLAERTVTSREDCLFALVLSLGSPNSGVCVLNGTKSSQRMEGTLRAITRLGTIPEFIREGFLDELR